MVLELSFLCLIQVLHLELADSKTKKGGTQDDVNGSGSKKPGSQHKHNERMGIEGEIMMVGEETDKMFQKKNCKARVAYLNGSENIETPPVELIQFVDNEVKKVQSNLFMTSISELCFYTDDIDTVYKKLIEKNVECLSEPQYFDFSSQGFGKSKAFYFKDPDGIILEMMQPL